MGAAERRFIFIKQISILQNPYQVSSYYMFIIITAYLTTQFCHRHLKTTSSAITEAYTLDFIKNTIFDFLLDHDNK